MSLLRASFIALGRNPQVQDWIVGFPPARRVARRFVGGETLEQARAAVQSLNEAGTMATVSYLGENVTDRAQAVAAIDENMRAIAAVQQQVLECNLSVKLSALGLHIDYDFCLENVRRIVQRAADAGNFMRLDMESRRDTGATLAIYRELRRDFDNVGVVVQAYLHRTRRDVEQLIFGGIAHLRICKGAYDEPGAIAFQKRARIIEEFLHLIRMLWEPEARARGAYAAIASHDEQILSYARTYAHYHGIARQEYEFQMLYGVRRDAQADLVRRGCRLRVYVPYGDAWYPYFMRRLAERPANLLFFLRALAGR